MNNQSAKTPLPPRSDTDKHRRNTKQKQLVLDTLVNLGSHISAGEIYKKISETYPAFSRATVFRVLSEMSNDGVLLKIITTSGECRYDITTHPHTHIVCRKCGKVADIEFKEEIDPTRFVISASGYKIESAFMELEGLCPECI